MNRKQLQKLGVPPRSVKIAIQTLSRAAEEGQGFGLKGKRAKELIASVLASPNTYLHDPIWSDFAQDLLSSERTATCEPIEYRTWGDDIDDGAHAQMKTACRVPSAVGAALMPDAHIGYGLPIGGVLACEGGSDPLCCGSRHRLPDETLGVGRTSRRANQAAQSARTSAHPGYSLRRWSSAQAEAAAPRDGPRLECLPNHARKKRHGLEATGDERVGKPLCRIRRVDPCRPATMHSTSTRAAIWHSCRTAAAAARGAAVCSTYSAIAQRMLPREHRELGRLAWLDLDTDEGQQYWAAMNLMGAYAAANHAVIHRLVAKLVGGTVIAGVENHHNFAWRETHGGRETIVHRKGATPAAAGEMGVIPGSMADPAFVVRGKGNAASLTSASHGAGRRMSRKKAKDTYRFSAVKRDLAQRGITVLAAGSDEVPGVYKDIREVMAAQRDLVEVVAQFDPKIVMMCGDGSRAED